MNKILIIPDSFKGTMSSREVGRILEEEARACWPEAEVTRVEVADGGEGTVDAFLAVLPGEKRRCRVHGPFGEWVDAAYGRMGETAVIEMAAAAGLPLAAGRPGAGQASTYGVGELLADAVAHGARRIVLGLGGSATNDGGAGAAGRPAGWAPVRRPFLARGCKAGLKPCWIPWALTGCWKAAPLC